MEKQNKTVNPEKIEVQEIKNVSEKSKELDLSTNKNDKPNYFVNKFLLYKKNKEEKLNQKVNDNRLINDVSINLSKSNLSNSPLSNSIDSVKVDKINNKNDKIQIPIEKRVKKSFFKFFSKNKSENAILDIIKEEEKNQDKVKNTVHKKQASNKTLVDEKENKKLFLHIMKEKGI